MADEVFVIGPRAGYDGPIGVLASMLQNARQFLLSAVRGLDPAALEARPSSAANSIGSILAHLAAAEKMLGFRAFENRSSTDEERAKHGPAFYFQVSGAGRTLDSYLEDLRLTREQTLAALRARKASWLDEPRTFAGKPANAHYFLLHYLQDEARHTGQIILIRKYLIPDAAPDFDPYVF